MDEFELLKCFVLIKFFFGEEYEILEFIVLFFEENGIFVEIVFVEGFGDDVVVYFKGKGLIVVLNGYMDMVYLF